MSQYQDLKKQCIPAYIATSFEYIRQHAKLISIQNFMLSKGAWTGNEGFLLFGGKSLKNIYFDESDDIKWDHIRLFFPLSRICITDHPDNNRPDSIEPKTILLTDTLMRDTYRFFRACVNMSLIL